MGTQQLLLVILGIIIVGIGIAVGIGLFSATSVSSNKDAIINDMMNISQYAYRYKLKPEPLGGGGRFYTGFILPSKLASNENATYTAVSTTPTSVTITATSLIGYGTIANILDSTGTLGTYTYTGDFQ